MVEGLIDTFKPPFTCLKCGDVTEKSLRWYVDHTRLFCPACGHEHDIAESDTRAAAMRMYELCKDLTSATTSPL